MSTALVTRIQSRLDRLGLTAQEASTKAGLNKDAIRNIMRGKSTSPRGVTLKAIAGVLGCSPQWLEGHDDFDPPEDERSAQQALLIEPLSFAGATYVALGVYDVRVSAGPGSINGEKPVPYAYNLFRQDWLSRLTAASPEALAVCRVSGDSMWDTLHDGDQVLIDRTVRAVGRDGIYVFMVPENAEVMVKRCQRDLRSKLLNVISDNPKYPPQQGVPDDAIQILGRVIWLGRNIGG